MEWNEIVEYQKSTGLLHHFESNILVNLGQQINSSLNFLCKDMAEEAFRRSSE